MYQFFRVLAALWMFTGVAVRAQEAAEIHIRGNDEMKYDVTAFEVKAGQKVRLTLRNAGKLPRQVMGHNLTILKPGSSKEAFALEANKFAANDYIPTSSPFKDQIIAHTRLLGPGESQTIEFTAPAEAGEYDYVCSFPGHCKVMSGRMTVK